ncbi:hypothetical protein ACLI4Y_11520 [Natrialbaceae archaeon A-CW3]
MSSPKPPETDDANPWEEGEETTTHPYRPNRWTAAATDGTNAGDPP